MPENLRRSMPKMIVRADIISHEGHGLLKPWPLELCHALAFVISSSGRGPAVLGTATVAAYSRAAVEEEVMMRKRWRVEDVREDGGGGGGAEADSG